MKINHPNGLGKFHIKKAPINPNTIKNKNKPYYPIDRYDHEAGTSRIVVEEVSEVERKRNGLNSMGFDTKQMSEEHIHQIYDHYYNSKSHWYV